MPSFSLERLRYRWRAHHYRRRTNRDEIAFLAGRVHPGDAVVDVGAHKGGFLYWLRHHAGAAGRVYGFEPQPGLARYLQRIVALQGWDNVTIEPAALSSSAGEMELHVPAPAGAASPGATLAPFGRDTAGHSLRVPVTTLDDYFATRGGRRVSFVKCDCEGHELDVFKGARGLLERDRPALVFECEQRHLPGGSPAAVFDYLRGLHYRGWFFGPDGLAPVEQFSPAVHQPVRAGRFWDAKDYFNNFAFLPEGSSD